MLIWLIYFHERQISFILNLSANSMDGAFLRSHNEQFLYILYTKMLKSKVFREWKNIGLRFYVYKSSFFLIVVISRYLESSFSNLSLNSTINSINCKTFHECTIIGLLFFFSDPV